MPVTGTGGSLQDHPLDALDDDDDVDDAALAYRNVDATGGPNFLMENAERIALWTTKDKTPDQNGQLIEDTEEDVAFRQKLQRMSNDSLEQLLADIMADKLYLNRVKMIQDFGHVLDRIKATMKRSSNIQFVSPEEAASILEDIKKYAYSPTPSSRPSSKPKVGKKRSKRAKVIPKTSSNIQIQMDYQSNDEITNPKKSLRPVSTSSATSGGLGVVMPAPKTRELLNECSRAIESNMVRNTRKNIITQMRLKFLEQSLNLTPSWSTRTRQRRSPSVYSPLAIYRDNKTSLLRSGYTVGNSSSSGGSNNRGYSNPSSPFMAAARAKVTRAPPSLTMAMQPVSHTTAYPRSSTGSRMTVEEFRPRTNTSSQRPIPNSKSTSSKPKSVNLTTGKPALLKKRKSNNQMNREFLSTNRPTIDPASFTAIDTSSSLTSATTLSNINSTTATASIASVTVPSFSNVIPNGHNHNYPIHPSSKSSTSTATAEKISLGCQSHLSVEQQTGEQGNGAQSSHLPSTFSFSQRLLSTTHLTVSGHEDFLLIPQSTSPCPPPPTTARSITPEEENCTNEEYTLLLQPEPELGPVESKILKEEGMEEQIEAQDENYSNNCLAMSEESLFEDEDEETQQLLEEIVKFKLCSMAQQQQQPSMFNNYEETSDSNIITNNNSTCSSITSRLQEESGEIRLSKSALYSISSASTNKGNNHNHNDNNNDGSYSSLNNCSNCYLTESLCSSVNTHQVFIRNRSRELNYNSSVESTALNIINKTGSESNSKELLGSSKSDSCNNNFPAPTSCGTSRSSCNNSGHVLEAMMQELQPTTTIATAAVISTNHYDNTDNNKNNNSMSISDSHKKSELNFDNIKTLSILSQMLLNLPPDLDESNPATDVKRADAGENKLSSDILTLSMTNSIPDTESNFMAETSFSAFTPAKIQSETEELDDINISVDHDLYVSNDEAGEASVGSTTVAEPVQHDEISEFDRYNETVKAIPCENEKINVQEDADEGICDKQNNNNVRVRVHTPTNPTNAGSSSSRALENFDLRMFEVTSAPHPNFPAPPLDLNRAVQQFMFPNPGDKEHPCCLALSLLSSEQENDENQDGDDEDNEEVEEDDEDEMLFKFDPLKQLQFHGQNFLESETATMAGYRQLFESQLKQAGTWRLGEYRQQTESALLCEPLQPIGENDGNEQGDEDDDYYDAVDDTENAGGSSFYSSVCGFVGAAADKLVDDVMSTIINEVAGLILPKGSKA